MKGYETDLCICVPSVIISLAPWGCNSPICNQTPADLKPGQIIAGIDPDVHGGLALLKVLSPGGPSSGRQGGSSAEPLSTRHLSPAAWDYREERLVALLDDLERQVNRCDSFLP